MAQAVPHSHAGLGWLAHYDSLAWRLIVPVPIAIVIAVVVIWAAVPRIVDSMAVTDTVLAARTLSGEGVKFKRTVEKFLATVRAA